MRTRVWVRERERERERERVREKIRERERERKSLVEFYNETGRLNYCSWSSVSGSSTSFLYSAKTKQNKNS